MSSNGRRAYGPLAERLAHCFTPSESVIVFDQFGAGQALRDGAGRAMRNEAFAVRAILQRPDALLADAVIPNILDAFAGTEERHFAISQAFAGTLSANNAPLASLQAYAPGAMRAMQALLRLSTGLIASSEAERRRVSGLLDSQPRALVRHLVDAAVPAAPHAVPSTKRDSVVIWAPHMVGDVALSFAYALRDLRFEKLIVASTPCRSNDIAKLVPLAGAESALARALVIVDTSALGCDAIEPLSKWGAPVVADIESGANEIFSNVRCFDRSRLHSIFEAVSASMGAHAPHLLASRTQASFPSQEDLLLDGPSVSVIIPTLDRPHMLAEALESVTRQTYRNIETLVVVDGGPRLDHLVGRFPNVRFLHMPENNPLHTSNTAFAETHGEYVAFLNDDDLYFPNHIAGLVTALERAKGNVAHGDVLTAFLRGADPNWNIYGFESNMSRAVALSALLVGNQIGMTSCMFGRDCIPDNAPFEEAVPLYRDYALWLRLAARSDFIHVEHITSCYTIRNDGAGQQSNMWYDKALKSYEVLYAQYSVKDQPMLERERQAVIGAVTNERMKLRPEPAVAVDGAWPLWED